MYQNSNLQLTKKPLQYQTITWRSPSNIAIVKYWGKYGQQYPKNASISFTLTNAFTEMSLAYSWKKEAEKAAISLDFLFEGEKNELFATKIEKFLHSILNIFPFLAKLHLNIQSKNSFPHSSGIASSASSMSALALCLCSLEHQLFGTLMDEEAFLQKASYVARLGSGSACRSVYPKAAIWGVTPSLSTANNDCAIPFGEQLHPIFRDFGDAILIVSRATKKVSSRAGHNLMNGHFYAERRYEQAQENLKELLSALQTGDINKFIEITENEALTLHSLMMTSHPSFILMKPETLAIIDKIRQFRETTDLPICFTLDAGPNIHLLYPKSAEKAVLDFIETDLKQLCEDGYWISDKMGEGSYLVQ